MSGRGLDALAGFASAIRFGSLPPVIAEKAQACLLYGLSVAIASARLPLAAQPLAATGGGPAVRGGATRWLDATAVGVEDAAFANAMLCHARIQEDAHPAGHVGVVVLPAVLAQAEQSGAGGHDLLAVAAGYEVALRTGRDHAAALSRRGFRTTSVYGPIGAAAACARLRRMDAGATAHAMALAANTACGLREFVDAGTEEFAFQAGIAARNALISAAMAAAGARAAGSVLEGAAGFYRAFGDGDGRGGERVAEALGGQWEFRDITYKPYPVCQFHRSLVTGVLEVRRRVEGAALSRMTITMHPFEADFFGVRYAGPYATFPQTFMSAPYCAALAWARGRVDYAGMHDFDARDIAAVVPSIEVLGDPATARYRPSVHAVLADGRSLDWQDTAGPDAYGLDWNAALDMCGRLFGEAGVGDAARARLVEAISALARDGDAAGVAAAAAGACASATRNP